MGGLGQRREASSLPSLDDDPAGHVGCLKITVEMVRLDIQRGSHN
jgi:hypothetical protein